MNKKVENPFSWPAYLSIILPIIRNKDRVWKWYDREEKDSDILYSWAHIFLVKIWVSNEFDKTTNKFTLTPEWEKIFELIKDIPENQLIDNIEQIKNAFWTPFINSLPFKILYEIINKNQWINRDLLYKFISDVTWIAIGTAKNTVPSSLQMWEFLWLFTEREWWYFINLKTSQEDNNIINIDNEINVNYNNKIEIWELKFEEFKEKKNTKREKRTSTKIDYLEKAERNQKTWHKWENFILQYENDRLQKEAIKEKIERVSLNDDSLWYDILSYEKDWKKRYIEVKTSMNWNNIFYISENELIKSETLNNYWIYRASLIKGKTIISKKQIRDKDWKQLIDLRKYCIPILYIMKTI
jgi:hypothetical protein